MENKKNSKSLIVLVIILVLCVLGLAGYIVFDKALSNNNCNIITTATNNKKNMTDDEKKCESEKNSVYNSVSKMLNEFIRDELSEYNIKFDYNYMDDTIAKHLIAVSSMLGNDKIEKNYDIDANNQRITGGVTFNKKDYINTYNTIIGEQPNIKEIIDATEGNYRKTLVNNSKISSSYVTGPVLYMIKLNNIVCSNTEYSLKIDYVYETNENTEVILQQFTNYEETKIFDDNLINALIDVNLSKNSDGSYKINYLKVIKK